MGYEGDWDARYMFHWHSASRRDQVLARMEGADANPQRPLLATMVRLQILQQMFHYFVELSPTPEC